MPAAKRKDFGFVTFDTHDNAVACTEGMSNSEIGEGEHKVCFANCNQYKKKTYTMTKYIFIKTQQI